MEIRELGAGDIEGLKQLILGVYKDSPLSMWFESEPSGKELDLLFESKIGAIKRGSAIDIVAIEKGRIVAECEIVISEHLGSVGVIVEKDHRRKGIGGRILQDAIGRARGIGTIRIVAEVVWDNQIAKGFFEKSGFEEKGISDREFRREGKRHKVIYLSKALI